MMLMIREDHSTDTTQETSRTAQEASRSAMTILLVDERQVVAEALNLSLGRYSQFESIVRASDIPAGMAHIRSLQPHLAIISGRLFESGFRMLSDEIAVRLGEVRLAVFVDDLSDRHLQAAADMNVAGYFAMADPLTMLAENIMLAAAGQTVVSASIRPRLLQNASTGKVHVTRREQLDHLSNRQLEVIPHLAEGLTVREIAERMHLSEKSIESHKFRIMKRLGLRNRVELCRWAIREGLVSP